MNLAQRLLLASALFYLVMHLRFGPQNDWLSKDLTSVCIILLLFGVAFVLSGSFKKR